MTFATIAPGVIMIPNPDFHLRPRGFWAHVRLVSETLGYSPRGKKVRTLRRFTQEEVLTCIEERGLGREHLYRDDAPTKLLNEVVTYLNFRADTLTNEVRPNLMNKVEARSEFERLVKLHNPKCYLPMNKQKGAKKHHNYLGCMVNILTEAELGNGNFDDNPRGLVAVTKNNEPLRVFSRWMDGAFPSITNPKAIWEVKEYYGTTTFGSRVADGVYETMLDGEEVNELETAESIDIKHYLIVDDHFTWWDCGRSYLCRIFDMIHMGLVDEAVFGKEVLTRWSTIVRGW